MDENEDPLELERKIAQASRIASRITDQTTYERLIPDLIDQNPCAHRRNPMDMIFQGRSMSVFQA